MSNIIITTTNSIEGHRIVEYKGLVSYRAWCATKNYLIGDPKNDKHADKYREFIKSAETGLQAEAARVGANAVVGVKFRLDAPFAATLLITGTAVVIE